MTGPVFSGAAVRQDGLLFFYDFRELFRLRSV